MKWGKYPVGHMVGVDIADTSIQQCKERYNINKVRRRVIPCRPHGWVDIADTSIQQCKERYNINKVRSRVLPY